MMENFQFFTLMAMLAGGFAWMLLWLRSVDGRISGLQIRMSVVENRILGLENRISGMENRMSVMEARLGFIERLIEMCGFPFKPINKQREDS